MTFYQLIKFESSKLLLFLDTLITKFHSDTLKEHNYEKIWVSYFLWGTHLLKLSRNCVYETLCPQPLVCIPSFSPGNLFIILFQLTKSEATSCNRIEDIFVGSFRCPNLQRAFTKKNAKGDKKIHQVI